MQIRMIFGTLLPPEEGEEPRDLVCGTRQEVNDALALELIGAGRAEPTDFTNKTYQAWLKKQPADTTGSEA